jgi:capsular polysaccharide biosynthesis protein
VLNMLRRRGWLLVVTTTIVAICAYLVGSARPATYSAEAVGVVPANVQLTPDQANRLAVTYVGLIPNDQTIATAAARALRTTPADVMHRTSAFNDLNTALVRIDYRAASPDGARAGAATVLNAIAGPHPVSRNIAPKAISVVAEPAKVSSSRSVKTLAAVGVLLGLALGALLIFTWERMDPRIDDVRQLSSELGCPASSFEAISDPTTAALLERWKTLARQPLARQPQLRVALLPVSSSVERELRLVADKLSRGLGDHTDATIRGGAGCVLLESGVVDEGSFDASVPMSSDVTIMVVERGTPLVAVRDTARILHTFGIAPAWAILMGSGTNAVASRTRLRPVRRVPEEAVTSSPEVLPLRGARRAG